MIDNTDKRIINELQKDGRQSHSKLAQKLGFVEGTIRRRFNRLLKEEMIKVIAAPNLDKLGYGFITIMGLQVRIKDLRAVATKLAQNQHLCYLAMVTGTFDMIAIALTQSREDLLDLIEREIAVTPGVMRIESFAILDIIKGKWGVLDTVEIVGNIDTSSL